MPNYKDGAFFGHRPTDHNFDTLYSPGQTTPFSGIYRCKSCGFEAVSTKGHTLPPERFCSSHSLEWKGKTGLVNWHLVAAAIHITGNA